MDAAAADGSRTVLDYFEAGALDFTAPCFAARYPAVFASASVMNLPFFVLPYVESVA